MDPKFRQLYIIFILSVIVLIGGGQMLIQYHISLLAQAETQTAWLKGLFSLKAMEAGIAFVILCVLLAEMFFLFRPAIRAMRFYKSKVSLINQELQTSNTQLLLSEKKLKRYVTELRNQGAALRLAKQKAEDASSKKGRFLSTMTHEIRTPLHAVTGIAQLLMRENPKPEQLEYLEMLRFSAENLMILINDILDFNKIEAGKIELEETTFNLLELAQGIKQSLTYKAGEKSIGLELITDGDMPSALVGDPVRISQILNNLIGNAIKFTDKGKVSIRIKVADERDNLVRLDFEIADSGIGIPEDKLPNIFESFTQASSDTTRKFGGSGLGLTITKELLHLMGSEIRVSSKKGKGSVFSFTLQLEKAKLLQAHAEQVIQVEKWEGRTIQLLLVEDNEINQVIASQLLRKSNIETAYAENGLVALEKLKTQQYDIILMDLQMPKMDGYEAALAIRAMKDVYYKTVPIIALTAAATTEAKNKVFECGMNGFATKPFKPEELFQTIAEHLNFNLVVQSAPLKGYELNEKIAQFCEGDQDFKQTLTELYILSFKELKSEYRTALEQKDARKISFTIHKHTTTISLLELSHLLSEMERGRALVNAQDFDENTIQISIAKVTAMCDEFLAELSFKIDLTENTGSK
jgi:signal transduction histidine kinase/DNA-binding response OmpR family regulator